MGFFDSVAKTIKNTNDEMIKTTWSSMKKMQKDQLELIYTTKGMADTKGQLAYLMLCYNFSAPYLESREEKENLERACKRDAYLMNQSREYNEIRDALEKAKRQL